jgi:replicative DNA helicase
MPLVNPPKNLRAEEFVLGCCMIEPAECMGQVLEAITADDFFEPDHAALFRVLMGLWQRKAAFGSAALVAEIEASECSTAWPEDRLRKLAEQSVSPTAADALLYAMHVREAAIKRRLMQAAMQTVGDVEADACNATDLHERAMQRFYAAAGGTIKHGAGMAEVLHETFAEMDAAAEGKSGIPTGFSDLDGLTNGGLHKGEMVIIAGRPSHGKSAFAMNLVEHATVVHQKPVAFFSLEMSKTQLAQRLLAQMSQVPVSVMVRGMLSPSQRDRINAAVSTLANAPLYIVDQAGMTPTQLRAKAMRMKHEHGVELVVIDYLQLMESPGENRQVQVSAISRGVKAMARDLNVPVLALCQLNRGSESDGRLPRTSDLRESGSLEQDADVVMLLHREAVLHRGDDEWFNANQDKANEALVIVAKQRQGACDTVRLHFDGAFTRFRD